MIVPFRNQNPKVDSKRRNTRNARSKRDGSGLERSPWDEKEHTRDGPRRCSAVYIKASAPSTPGPGVVRRGFFIWPTSAVYCSRHGRGLHRLPGRRVCTSGLTKGERTTVLRSEVPGPQDDLMTRSRPRRASVIGPALPPGMLRKGSRYSIPHVKERELPTALNP